ncbi:MAG TPA: GH116 family glycosyl-hydrolase, partial [Silvibacterium sp.]|nr:GH116 family glycosyl-hydrolase [Silvibacterium sp.]
MTDKYWVLRRDFLKQAAGVFGAATQSGHWTGFDRMEDSESREERRLAHTAAANDIDISYPRQFSGRQVRMISFPLGGVAAGSIGLGGRGQLINWEFYNHPDKGRRPPYALPSIWVQSGTERPIARVLESRTLPPYEGEDGLGSDNAPGLSRLEEAIFTGEYPLAHIDFQDRSLPVNVELDAFSPFIPHEADDSGLPVAILRYRVTNLGAAPARVGVAFSVDNPVKANNLPGNPSDAARDKRLNEFYSVDGLVGLLMSNPGLAADDPYAGSFALAAIPTPDSSVSHWRGWPRGRWWNSPLLFWDQFSKAGELGAQPEPYNIVGVLCVQQTILPGQAASFQFLLGWHLPNRTPDSCGWTAPPGEGKTFIGNYYSTRFKD